MADYALEAKRIGSSVVNERDPCVITGSSINDINAAKITSQTAAKLADIQAEMATIKAKTDALTITGGLVEASVDKTGYTLADGELSEITSKLPTGGKNIAGEGVVAKNLDQVTTDPSTTNATLNSVLVSIRNVIGLLMTKF